MLHARDFPVVGTNMTKAMRRLLDKTTLDTVMHQQFHSDDQINNQYETRQTDEDKYRFIKDESYHVSRWVEKMISQFMRPKNIAQKPLALVTMSVHQLLQKPAMS